METRQKISEELASLIVESQKDTLLERVNEIFASGESHPGPEEPMDKNKGETFLGYWTPYEAAIYSCSREIADRNNEMIKACEDEGNAPDPYVVGENHREHSFLYWLFWRTVRNRFKTANEIGIRNGGIIVEIQDDESEVFKIVKKAIDSLVVDIFGSQEPKKREKIVDGPSLVDLGVYFIRKQEFSIPMSFEFYTNEAIRNFVVIKEFKLTGGNASTLEFKGVLANRGISDRLVEGVYSFETKTGWLEVGEEVQ